MKWCKPAAILIVGMVSTRALAQPTPITQTTVCDIVNTPLQFEGKLVRVRAQIWSDIYDVREFWMNEVVMRSGKVCHFLKARINGPTFFAGANGFGTFTGRLVRESAPLKLDASGSKVRLVFIVEQESDVYGIQNLNGPVPRLRVYDRQTGSFITAEQHTAQSVVRCDARPVPGTSALKVSCVETDLPAHYDVWKMIFQP